MSDRTDVEAKVEEIEAPEAVKAVEAVVEDVEDVDKAPPEEVEADEEADTVEAAGVIVLRPDDGGFLDADVVFDQISSRL